MIDDATYLDEVLASIEPFAPSRFPTGPMPGARTAGLYLAESITAVWDTPSFTNSAMDGFAVAVADLIDDGSGSVTLPVVDDIAAGSTGSWRPGGAVRIMTGAPMPEGTDTVVPVEHTDHAGVHGPMPDRVRLPATWPPDRHVRHRGSDVAAGAELLGRGTVLDGASLAALVGAGVMSVSARRRARVGVVVTGDELATIDEVSIAGGILDEGRILNSNSILVAETLPRFGADVVFEATCSDAIDAFDQVLGRAAAADLDVLITTGGASVGAHDVARQVLGELGVRFQSVAIQPAKPQGFGLVDGLVVCALPGNPGAVHASLWVIVRPVLAKLMGAPVPAPGSFRVAQGWSAKKGMRQFVPVVIDGEEIRPVIPGGIASHRVASLARADGLASVAPEVTEVAVGDHLEVIITRP